MSERKLAKQIVDHDELEDGQYCERLVSDYLNNADPGKHEYITLKELAKREGTAL